jgi:hypothetical protein
MGSKKQVAIDAKCKDCCYDELDIGTWREQVERSPCGSCPLYEFRPKTIRAEQQDREQRVMMRQENPIETPRLH